MYDKNSIIYFLFTKTNDLKVKITFIIQMIYKVHFIWYINTSLLLNNNKICHYITVLKYTLILRNILHYKWKEYLNTMLKIIRSSLLIIKMYILNTLVVSEANLLL